MTGPDHMGEARRELDQARADLRAAVAAQPRHRLLAGEPECARVVAAHDRVEVWTSAVRAMERRGPAAVVREVTWEAEVEDGVLALEWTGGPLQAPCRVRDQYGDEREVLEVAWQHCPKGGTWFGTVRVAVLTMEVAP